MWPASAFENNNSGGTVHVKRESESDLLMDTSQAPVEKVDQNAGYEDFSQEFDLNNYIQNIKEGVNFGKFKCSICGHVSSRMTNLQSHVGSKHFPGQFSCDQCEEKFNNMKNYCNHLSSRHSNMKSKVDSHRPQ